MTAATMVREAPAGYGTDANPSGLCWCGCGRRAPLAQRTNLALGIRKGRPQRYVMGHHKRKPVGVEPPVRVADGVLGVPLVGERGAGKVALVEDADYPLVAGTRWHLIPAGYAVHSLDKRSKLWMHVHILGERPGLEVDHVNGDRLDNRRSNLRYATRSQQMMNQGKAAGKSSMFKGVRWAKREGRWCAYIKADGRQVGLGHFDDEVEAALAYDAAAIAAFGEYARVNFPDRLRGERS